VECKAPLTRFYAERSIESLGDGARNFQRWRFEQGGAALVGAMRESEPVAGALASMISGGGGGAGAAQEAQEAVERLAAALD
jgi:hypothetical protein